MEAFKKLFLLFFLMSISSGYALTTYCATPRTSANPSGTYTLNYTCRNVSGTTYEMKLEFPNAVTNISNANMGANPGPINVAASPVWSNGNKTLTYTFTAASTPSLYVATIFVIISGTEVRWDLPTDANFAATCGGGGGNPTPVFGSFSIAAKTVGDADFTIPTVTTDSGGAITYTSGTPTVATIVNGNQIHVVGAGTSLITLSQAADATHSAGTTSTTLTVNPAPPSTAAPTPPARNSWDVISLYSDAYTTLSGVAHQHGTAVTIAGDPTRYLANMLLSRIAFPPTNFSAMTTLHVDVYCGTIGTIWLQFQGSSVTKTVAATGWVSLDVPLTQFTGSNFASISFFDLNNPTGAGAPQDNVWVDNVYFYRSATTQPPTLGAFAVPTKNLGDADFAITAPSSNSAGAWSYASGSTGVATIVNGNMIHIVGPGSSIITATQAANGVYGQGVATATFTVNYPDPPVSPTQPARSPSDVISLFASAYSNIAGTDFNPNWGQASNYPSNMTTPTYSGEQVKRYLNSGTYQGTAFTTSNVTVINKLHIDIYSYTMTSVRISLINAGGAEAAYALALTPNSWNSFNIDVNSTNFPGVNLAAVNQIKYDQFKIGAAETGNQVLIIDNLYFYRETNVPPTIGAFAVGPNVLGDANYAITAPSSNSAGAWSYSSSNTAVATIVGGNTIHIAGAGTSTITATQAANGIYASATTSALLTVTVPPLTAAAPTPPVRNAWDVISLYSEAYPALVGATWQMGTDVVLESNVTRYIENMLLARLAFPPTNVSAMTYLHIDVYSETLNPMWFQLQGNSVTKSTPVNGWVSLDIPLSQFVGLNLTNVNFFDLNNPTGAVAPADNVFVDNVYFYRPATTQPATLSDFSVPTKAYNDSDFEITPPTSNSSGTFAYSSSNTNVATIVNGNMIHIVGGGVSTITATQAPDGGSYGTASITAQFTVTFAPPSASPIPPARTPDRVVSMFTGNPPVYANAITPVSAAFSGATMTEIPNGSNTALQLNNFGVLGLTDAAEVRFDVSGMSHLHIDIYLNEPLNANPALSRVNIFLLANGDYLYQASNLTAGWNSLSIPMTNFSAANLTQVWGLKLENINTATQVHIDNVYFSNECYTYYADADTDGYGNPSVTQSVCDGTGAPAGYIVNNTDCDDTKSTVHPNATEVAYNLIDDDCDGLTDEGFPVISTIIQSAACNATLSAIDSYVYANLVAGANGYRWRVTKMVDGVAVGSSQFLTTALRSMKITQLANYAFNTQYKIEVAVYYNGFLQAFTPSSCTVSTPATPTQLVSCAATPTQLTALSDVIYATQIPFATGYRFRITDPTNAGLIQELYRSLREFRMNLITAFPVQYNKIYNVEVSIKNTDGTYLPYVSTCQIKTPVFPTTSMQDSQCDDYAVPSMATQLYAVSAPGAIAYAFNLSGNNFGVNGQEVVKNLRTFKLSDFSGLIPGATYNVKVRLIFNNNDPAGLYGKTCTIIVPAVARVAQIAFNALAYPNPFSDGFNINVTTSVHENINIKVYDMTGRLLDNRSVTPADSETLSIGDELPSGVYNVIVSQGDDVKTLRVIKR
jgi:hypothetical protein